MVSYHSETVTSKVVKIIIWYQQKISDCVYPGHINIKILSNHNVKGYIISNFSRRKEDVSDASLLSLYYGNDK